VELKNNLTTETGWEIAEKTFDPDQLVTTGSNFMMGNGYLGYRGTMAEWEADRYTACIVSDTYDQVGDYRELCNVPNGLFTRLFAKGERLSLFTGETSDYVRRLDLRYGLYSRSQTWQGSLGHTVRIDTERFASYDNVHLMAMRYRFQVEERAKVVVFTGIDGNVWNLNGEHFKTYEPSIAQDLLLLETVTGESGITIDVAEGVTVLGPQPQVEEIIQSRRRILRRLYFYLDPGEAVILDKVVAIYTSNDVAEPRQRAAAATRSAKEAGYETLKERHQAAWDAVWAISDVEIEGDLEDQTLTRFNLYQNIIATPTHARLPIGARGLSCQVYQGAAFWDQEIFNLPMFLYTRPEVARNILAYRHDTLDGARKKAKRLGYYGAFYAWTSGKTGEELFPDFFFTNVLTGRKIRNHFNDWQIHISPDIVYAIWQYYRVTGDWDFVVDYGAEIAFEVAQFLVSHAYFKKDKGRYEFVRLLGPDEYHENVDNNAFTNYQAQFALQTTVALYEAMCERTPETLASLFQRLDLGTEDVETWRDMADRIYLPQPDPETLVIEQFDGYFDLEDVHPETLRERLLDPEEYWGWPNGVAVRTQVLKQADVLQLLALHPDRFPVEVMRANYDYYEPRTEHGSSLSPSVHALIASRAGYQGESYTYFKRAATIDLYNASKKVMSGGAFLGGIHTAACGAVWQMIVQGFAGFRMEEDSILLAPALPTHWERLAFKLIIGGNLLEIEIEQDQVGVTAAERNEGDVTLQVGEGTRWVGAGETVQVAL